MSRGSIRGFYFSSHAEFTGELMESGENVESFHWIAVSCCALVELIAALGSIIREMEMFIQRCNPCFIG